MSLNTNDVQLEQPKVENKPKEQAVQSDATRRAKFQNEMKQQAKLAQGNKARGEGGKQRKGSGARVVKLAVSSATTNKRSRRSAGTNEKDAGDTAGGANPNTGLILNNGNSTAGGTSNSGDALTGVSGTTNSSSQQLLQQTEALQELNQTFNLQYLNLQENVQAENRQYTAVSNVSKTKSETAKNAISNYK